MKKRLYKQQCGVARALDLLGDRWTLLIVRDLCVGPCQFAQLQRSLAAMGPNLLSARLRELQRDGLVEKSQGAYQLTANGQSLRPLLRQLMALGKLFVTPDVVTEDDMPVPAKTALAVLFDPLSAIEVQLLVSVEVGDEHFCLFINNGRLEVQDGAAPLKADVVLRASVAGFNQAANPEASVDRSSDTSAHDQAEAFKLTGSATGLANFRKIFALPITQLQHISALYG